MNHVLFHVPHSSLKLPEAFWNICTKDRGYIDETNLFMSDHKTDMLVPDDADSIIFEYSRLFCDVEKFKDDSREVMAAKGMGAVYTCDWQGKIAEPDPAYREEVISRYYDKYHEELNIYVSYIIEKHGRCTIIDLHSYPEKMVEHVLGITRFPDICIGTDDTYTGSRLTEMTVAHFEEHGYSTELNSPYSGTMIPNRYFEAHDDRLESIMLEINKRMYLETDEDFNRLRKCIDGLYRKIERL